MSTKALTASERIGEVRSFLEANKQAIRDALPRHMNPDKMLRVALTTFTKTPKLLECSTNTLYGKVLECSQLGLEPDGILGSAYLLPFRNNQAGRTDCQLIIGYRGMIDLMMRSGLVTDVYAVPVYENEPFKIAQGLSRDLQHTPLPPDKRGKNIIGVYAVAVMKDGPPKWEFMYSEDIIAIGKKGRAYNNGPWQTHAEEMMKKTVIRRLAKTAKLSPEVERAAAVDEYEEQIGNATPTVHDLADERPRLVDTIAVEDEVPPPDEEPVPPAEEQPETDSQEGPQSGEVHKEFFEALMGYCNGDPEAAESLCEELTFFKAPKAHKGRGLKVDEIAGANPKRISIALGKLRELIEKADSWGDE